MSCLCYPCLLGSPKATRLDVRWAPTLTAKEVEGEAGESWVRRIALCALGVSQSLMAGA